MPVLGSVQATQLWLSAVSMPVQLKSLLSLQRRFSISSWQQSSFLFSAPPGTLRCNFLFINQADHEMYLRCNIKFPPHFEGPNSQSDSLCDFTLNTRAMHISWFFFLLYYYRKQTLRCSRPPTVPVFVVACVWVGVPSVLLPCICWEWGG